MDRLRLHNAAARIRAGNPQSLIRQRQQMLAEKRLRLTNAMRIIIEAERKRFAVLAAELQAVSPLDTLRRGYTIVENQRGQLVRSVADLAAQDEIVGRLADGRFTAVVRKILND